MSNTITIALLGLGRIGQQFAESLTKHIEEGNKALAIVAVAESNPDSEAAEKFNELGIPVYTDALDMVDLGDRVDIIFDLTGAADLRQAMRKRLQEKGNQHTVLVPEVFARMMWTVLEDGESLVAPLRSGY